MGETPMLREEPLSPITRRGRLETDVFCAGCGYNLHGQDVWPDERLGIPVCRCPECGKYHPAGVGVTASKLWLQRFGTLLLLLWTVIVVNMAVAWTWAAGGMQFGYVNLFTYAQVVAQDGTPLVWQNISPQSIPGMSSGYLNPKTNKIETGPTDNVQVFDPAKATFPVNPSEVLGWRAASAFCFGATMLGIVGGAALAVALWHWPRRRYPWVCVLPLIAFGFVLLGLRINDQWRYVRGWAASREAMVMGYEIVGLLIGLRVGRPIARAIVRVVVPPRPRMVLGFLWYADALVVPAGRPAGGQG